MPGKEKLANSYIASQTSFSFSHSDGAQLCGLYIAASNILDMIENKHEVDVYYVVQQIKAARPEFIKDEVWATFDPWFNLQIFFIVMS